VKTLETKLAMAKYGASKPQIKLPSGFNASCKAHVARSRVVSGGNDNQPFNSAKWHGGAKRLSRLAGELRIFAAGARRHSRGGRAGGVAGKMSIRRELEIIG